MCSNVLLVEGETDKRVIPEFIEKNGIQWEFKPKQYVVKIKSKKSKESLLNQKQIQTELKDSQVKVLGIVVDADQNVQETQNKIEIICHSLAGKNFFDNKSNDKSNDGWIFELDSGKKFGVWMMPNNENEGMLETFLSNLIPEKNPEDNHLWQYTKEVVKEAKKRGATFKNVHQDKAQIHTWLAWQNEPGTQLHNALKFKILDPTHHQGKKFFDWFKQLYSL